MFLIVFSTVSSNLEIVIFYYYLFFNIFTSVIFNDIKKVSNTKLNGFKRRKHIKKL